MYDDMLVRTTRLRLVLGLKVKVYYPMQSYIKLIQNEKREEEMT
jgi:hypothetical protein